VWHVHEALRSCLLVEDFIQAQKYIVYIFKVSVHNLTRHCDGSFVLILMTRGQTGFEGYSVCYASETLYEGQKVIEEVGL
jgi:hypothetical protein